MLVITARDDEILDVLTLRVRLLTLDQVARTWWSGFKTARQSALFRLRQLEDAGRVHLFDLVAHPEISLSGPVTRWKPRSPVPDFHAASYRLSSRWTELPVCHLGVIATRGSGRHYGGWGGRYPRPTERTHDLHVATVFLFKRAQAPDSSKHWLSEERIRRDRHRRNPSGESSYHLPDAIIKRPKRTVIEFGGSYSASKLTMFHEYCASQGWPYEIW